VWSANELQIWLATSLLAALLKDSKFSLPPERKPALYAYTTCNSTYKVHIIVTKLYVQSVQI
jgi:hypothetical protein